MAKSRLRKLSGYCKGNMRVARPEIIFIFPATMQLRFSAVVFPVPFNPMRRFLFFFFFKLLLSTNESSYTIFVSFSSFLQESIVVK